VIPLSRALYLFIFISFILLISACTGHVKSSQGVLPKQSDPPMSATNINVLFSDSGVIQARLTSPLLNRYSGNDACMEFPKGFTVYVFDSVRNVTSTIKANYGKRKELDRVMQARGNVIVRNEKKNEQLNTEQLTWDEKNHRIYSTVKIKITSPDKVLYGDGIESNEDFTRYTIINPTGQMMVKKDSL